MRFYLALPTYRKTTLNIKRWRYLSGRIEQENSAKSFGNTGLRGFCRVPVSPSRGQILSPWLGGHSRLWHRVVVPVRKQHRLTARYVNPTPESTISPRQGLRIGCSLLEYVGNQVAQSWGKRTSPRPVVWPLANELIYIYMLLHNCADLAEVGTSIFQIDKSIFDNHGSWISLSNYRFTKKINSLIANQQKRISTGQQKPLLLPDCTYRCTWTTEACSAPGCVVTMGQWYTHKTSVFKTSGFKTSEMSGLQIVRFTKCQIYKTSGLQNVWLQKNIHICSVLVVGGNLQVLLQPCLQAKWFLCFIFYFRGFFAIYHHNR